MPPPVIGGWRNFNNHKWSDVMEPYLGESKKPGYTLFEDDEGKFWWRDCATPECDNQVCTWLSNTLCHPCTTRRAAQSVAKTEAA